MKIAIDLRSLSSGSISGVENYTLNLLDNLLALDKKNTYVLFYNSFLNSTPSTTPSPFGGHPSLKRRGEDNLGEFHYVNSTAIKTRYPNKLLNLALKLKATSLEKIIGPFDCLFMPNLNQFNISPSAKLAITVHDLSPIQTPEFYDLKRRIWHKFLDYQKSFQRANVIFAVSEYTKLDLIRLFNLPAEKIKVVYPGADSKVFRPGIEESKLRDIRHRYQLPGDYLLFLNTVEPRKNLINLVKAFNLLDWPGSLVIAGKIGWKFRHTLEEIRHSNKSGRIKYLGYVGEQDKPGVIKMAKALVYPSFYEGFGFQPLEAMAVGTPVVASSVTAVPEVVQDAALLVNPYSVEEILLVLQDVIEDVPLRNRLIEKGTQRAAEFSWGKSAEQILEGLNQL